MNDDPEWNPDDFRFSFPDVYFLGGPLVEMPLVMKADKVRRYVGAVLTSSANSLAVGGEIPATLAGLATIDYLAGYCAGRQSQARDYKAYMTRYFPTRYQPHLDSFYTSLRCGLMHNLVAVSPWQPGHPHFLIVGNCESHMVVEDRRIVFCVVRFLEDVRRSWIRFSFDLIQKPVECADLRANFERRFDRLCGSGAFMVQVPDGETGTT